MSRVGIEELQIKVSRVGIKDSRCIFEIFNKNNFNTKGEITGIQESQDVKHQGWGWTCADATLCLFWLHPLLMIWFSGCVWFRFLKSSFPAWHGWVWLHEQLVATNLLWTCILDESLWHTNDTHPLSYSSAVFLQCPVQCAPFLSDLHPLFREIRTRLRRWQWGINSKRCYMVSWFPFRSQTYSFLFSYENKIILMEFYSQGPRKN